MGFRAGQDITSAWGCTLIGNTTGRNITTGADNTCVGHNNSLVLTTGIQNTVIGVSAGATLTTGGSNVCLGMNAGSNQLTTGSGSLWIARSGVSAGNDEMWIYGNSVGGCTQGNNSSSWTTTSDRRLKKNIFESSKGLDEINQLRVTNFEYRTEDEIDISEFPLADNPNQVVLGKGNEGVHTGVIAQEVESILPECIEISERGAKTVKTDPIMWALVNAVKELSARVKELESKSD